MPIPNVVEFGDVIPPLRGEFTLSEFLISTALRKTMITNFVGGFPRE